MRLISRARIGGPQRRYAGADHDSPAVSRLHICIANPARQAVRASALQHDLHPTRVAFCNRTRSREKGIWARTWPGDLDFAGQFAVKRLHAYPRRLTHPLLDPCCVVIGPLKRIPSLKATAQSRLTKISTRLRVPRIPKLQLG